MGACRGPYDAAGHLEREREKEWFESAGTKGHGTTKSRIMGKRNKNRCEEDSRGKAVVVTRIARASTVEPLPASAPAPAADAAPPPMVAEPFLPLFEVGGVGARAQRHPRDYKHARCIS